jgi:hypothetical protein
MEKRVNITLGYYPKSTGVTPNQLDEANRLLDENGYAGAYGQYILKYGMRNPYKRITSKNCIKLIKALKENKQICFIDKS